MRDYPLLAGHERFAEPLGQRARVGGDNTCHARRDLGVGVSGPDRARGHRRKQHLQGGLAAVHLRLLVGRHELVQHPAPPRLEVDLVAQVHGVGHRHHGLGGLESHGLGPRQGPMDGEPLRQLAFAKARCAVGPEQDDPVLRHQLGLLEDVAEGVRHIPVRRLVESRALLVQVHEVAQPDHNLDRVRGVPDRVPRDRVCAELGHLSHALELGQEELLELTTPPRRHHLALPP
mmetsp:Transcript_19034/g.50278  ORF Transcript_19034/g.50278 Transcript_19034/m.50278 type:complete len:232 (+) Transcript_19034:272-967(+)